MRKYLLLILMSFLLHGCISAAVTGASAAYNHNQIEQTASDYALNLKAKQAIANDKILANCHISVATFKHLSLLTGEVATAKEKQHAVKVLQKVPGIKRIYNALNIGPPSTTLTEVDDDWLTTKVKAQLIAANGINPNDIKVVTEDGIVYLMGIITYEQAALATNIARKTSGVEKVVDIFYYMTMPRI